MNLGKKANPLHLQAKSLVLKQLPSERSHFIRNWNIFLITATTFIMSTGWQDALLSSMRIYIIWPLGFYSQKQRHLTFLSILNTHDEWHSHEWCICMFKPTVIHHFQQKLAILTFLHQSRDHIVMQISKRDIQGIALNVSYLFKGILLNSGIFILQMKTYLGLTKQPTITQ